MSTAARQNRTHRSRVPPSQVSTQPTPHSSATAQSGFPPACTTECSSAKPAAASSCVSLRSSPTSEVQVPKRIPEHTWHQTCFEATCVANRHGEKSRGQCLVRAVVERAPLRPDRCVSYASNEVAKRPAPSGSYRLKTLHSETKTFTDPSLEPEVLNAIGAYAG